ncbi:Na(+)/H(+) antiporter subunit C [Nocardioides sp.]|uniref:Na(+)/H(+) antiporter subunit C n=1 Tax=Nocardioides sp. TaxID=35761 RepID=UPI00273355F3|nr:Na(+)/H(+) antiporter subunit C [Nocardioides sp.]MDP3893708.1 Na(+)/H(+) antiporter subunit C [Nocardioides sp.]
MEANVTLILTAAAMIGCGVYLVLERSLTRVLIGLVLISNAANLLLLVAGGPAGQAPIVGESPTAQMADPLPQALVLTAIVISLAMIAFVLAMAYRSWQLEGHDDVQDDAEDARIRRLAAADAASQGYDLTDGTDDDEVFEEEGR